MSMQADNKKPFITLLAHANCPTLPMGLIDSTLVLTESEAETSALLANKLFNLIIIDIALNELGLITVAKTSDCINCHTPIIALVGKDDPEQRKPLISAGFDDCLLKPLDTDKLNEFISLWRENDTSAQYLGSIETLLTIFKGNKDVVLTLYTKLFEELPQQIDQIKFALKNREYQFASDITHKINNTARVCYLKGIEELAKPLEDCLKQESHDLAEGYFSMLRESINTLMNHRQTIIGHLGKSPTEK